MATIEYRLSTKVQQDGRAEIMVRFFHGRSINQSTGTEIFALPSFFEYYIDRAKTEGMGIHVPFRVNFRHVARYVGFVRATDKERADYSFDIDKITKDDIEDFCDYLRNEKELSDQYPNIFARLIKDYPSDIKKGSGIIHAKGENSVIELIKHLRSFFSWLYEQDYTKNDPFRGVTIGTQHYGKPYYITIEERNRIAEADLSKLWEKMPDKEKKGPHYSLEILMQQRDMFVFQCFVGCRISDLMELTGKNIIHGILQYYPHKTKDDGAEVMMASVPLHPKALALVEKYKGVDQNGRLFPFISSQKYNDAIKLIFTMTGITREVVVRNPTTGEFEARHINEIASSHLARRTFVGNAYLKAPDPNIIGAMSGHAEGSKAFRRYRNIEESTKRAIIDMMG